MVYAMVQEYKGMRGKRARAPEWKVVRSGGHKSTKIQGYGNAKVQGQKEARV